MVELLVDQSPSPAKSPRGKREGNKQDVTKKRLSEELWRRVDKSESLSGGGQRRPHQILSTHRGQSTFQVPEGVMPIKVI